MTKSRTLDLAALEVSSFETQSPSPASNPTVSAACSMMWCDPYETVTICTA